MSKLLETGKIVNTHGIRGEVKIEPWSDSPDFLCQFKYIYTSEDKKYAVERARVHKQCVICKLKEVENIDDALAMLNKTVYIDKTEIKLDEGVYFFEDLIGLEVRDERTQRQYGKITDVFRTGSNDVYTVEDKEGKAYYVPAISDVVKKVDLGGGVMFIEPLEGIFDEI